MTKEYIFRLTFLPALYQALGEDRSPVLLLDEFDVLDLAASLPVTEMNRRSHEINPLGSPFFNNLIETRLLPLLPAEINQLIDQSLDGSGVHFTQNERAYIIRTSGRHPFLVQIACAALFEAVTQGQSSAKRRTEVERLIQLWAHDHFGDVWRHLNADGRRAMLLLALAETPISSNTANLAQLEKYDSDLRWLASGGLIEMTTDKASAAWSGGRWHVSGSAFVRWMIDNRKWEEVEGRATVAPPNEAEQKERMNFLHKKVTETRRRFQVLELQRAQKDNTADPAIITEIEDLQRAIAADERELERLGGRG